MLSKVEIFEKKNKIPYSKNFIKKITKMILKSENIKNYDISIAYLDKEDLRELNKKYRNLDRTTNILSFVYEKEPTLKGEIIISSYSVEKKGENFLKLYIHGLLHLAGYDHMENKDRVKMRNLEEKYFNMIYEK
jgi:probable rRNA maturation factor